VVPCGVHVDLSIRAAVDVNPFTRDFRYLEFQANCFDFVIASNSRAGANGLDFRRCTLMLGPCFASTRAHPSGPTKLFLDQVCPPPSCFARPIFVGFRASVLIVMFPFSGWAVYIGGSIKADMKFPKCLRCFEMHPGLCRTRDKAVFESTPLVHINAALLRELQDLPMPPPHFCRLSLEFSSGSTEVLSFCVAHVVPNQYAVVMPCDCDLMAERQEMSVQVRQGEVVLTSAAALIAQNLKCGLDRGDDLVSAAVLPLRVIDDVHSASFSLLRPLVDKTPPSGVRILFDRNEVVPEIPAKKKRSDKLTADGGERDPIEEGLPGL
jgi:hypothetical protein